MREYELTIIVHPEMDESEFSDILERVNSWIKDSGGQVLDTDIWGMRTLAYPIQKLTEGQYVHMNISIDAQFGSELERNLGFTEPVLRYLLISKQE
jgi:small subunit ribosomal protein S6